MSSSSRTGPARSRPIRSEGHVEHRRGMAGLGFAAVLVALCVALALSIILAVTLGPADISPGTAWRIVIHQFRPDAVPADWLAAHERIVWYVRLPRALLAVLVGATLAVVGTVLQAMVRNPLADPTILGGTSGAAVGAVSVIVLGWAFAGTFTLPVAAFAGGLVGYGLAFLLANSARGLSPLRMVLAGIAVSFLFSALTSMLIFMSEQSQTARLALFWMLGALGGARWDRLGLPAVLLVVGLVYLQARARALNLLLFGDETATSMGVPPDRLRRILFVVVALLTGTSVALAGGVGFVGLVIPHGARMVVGADHRRVLPLAALVGAFFLLWSDVAARLVIAPRELPIGVITALVGAPVFALLLRYRLRESDYAR
ncbi:MAG: iron ABC transporter permease [bacterium]|nr:iron ABC transporter permease [bacterium]MDE0438868.1 iron ABC transporter permease [bacterium]